MPQTKETYVEIKHKKSTKKECSQHIYGPDDFNIGSRVRIYLGWVTSTDVFIREGTVTNTRKEKQGDIGKRLSLELRVETSGRMSRHEPCDKAVLNAYGYTVWGHPSTRKVDKPYTASYFYHCITHAEKIK